jgi:hypothetical protein
MNNPVQVARSDTQLGDVEYAKENPRGKQAVKKVMRMFRAECTANGERKTVNGVGILNY